MDITLAQRLARNLTNLILQGKVYMMPAVLSEKEYALDLDNSVSEELVALANRLGDPSCVTTKNVDKNHDA